MTARRTHADHGRRGGWGEEGEEAMWIDAMIRINIPTSLVDQTGSIVAAVVDTLGINASEAVDIDQWTWQYDSNAEYAWADALDRQPLTGEPWAEEQQTP